MILQTIHLHCTRNTHFSSGKVLTLPQTGLQIDMAGIFKGHALGFQKALLFRPSRCQTTGMVDHPVARVAKISAGISFFVPEILETEKDIILDYMKKNENLRIYEFMFHEIYRRKEHCPFSSIKVMRSASPSKSSPMSQCRAVTKSLICCWLIASKGFGS